MESSSDSSKMGDEFVNNMLFLVATVFLLGRMWMDIFIVSINCRDWMKKKRLSTTDRILTLQGSIRIWMGSTITVGFFLVKLCPWVVQIGYVLKAFIFNFWYITSCNVWLTASLCSYYCVKIADFSHPFFIHLKQRLPGLESSWLLGSAVLSLASILPFVLHDWEIQGNKSFPDSFKNKNETDNRHTMMGLRKNVFLGYGYFAAFGICATSVVLLVFSLWRHRQRMLGSWGGHRSPQTEAHFQAVVTILSLLISNVIVFICIQVLLLGDYEIGSVYHAVASFVIYGCFSADSFTTIWGNTKLKNELRRSLHVAKCRQCVR